MADIAVGAFVQTEEFVADEKVVDMDPKMRLLDPDQTQFTTMTQRSTNRVATREKVNWLEEQYVNTVITLTAGHTAGATTVVVSGTDGVSVQAQDVVRNMRTGEALLVTANAAGSLTVVPSWGNMPAASVAGLTGDKLLIVGDAQKQGADIPQMKYSQRVLGFNYTQIHRTSWVF